MKKIIIMMIIALVCLNITACSNTNNKTNESSNQDSTLGSYDNPADPTKGFVLTEGQGENTTQVSIKLDGLWVGKDAENKYKELDGDLYWVLKDKDKDKVFLATKHTIKVEKGYKTPDNPCIPERYILPLPYAEDVLTPLDINNCTGTAAIHGIGESKVIENHNRLIEGKSISGYNFYLIPKETNVIYSDVSGFWVKYEIK